MDKKELMSFARAARERAHSPYSRVTVGAALLCADGKIFTGANIENSSYGATVCAERVALFTAIHSGERGFEAIAISGGAAGEVGKCGFYPCGICRQVLSEFCKSDFKVILEDEDGDRILTLGELLPYSFGKDLL